MGLVDSEFEWVPGEHPNLPGVAEKTEERDAQCLICGRWFDRRGVAAHENNCWAADFGDRQELPGSGERTSETQQQCQYCERWFDLRGIDSHRENCWAEGGDPDRR